jgi:hypothetical protein
MWKCQSCDEKFETEEELIDHQTDRERCIGCCHIYCEKCKYEPIFFLDIGTTICCQCGREN